MCVTQKGDALGVPTDFDFMYFFVFVQVDDRYRSVVSVRAGEQYAVSRNVEQAAGTAGECWPGGETQQCK